MKTKKSIEMAEVSEIVKWLKETDVIIADDKMKVDIAAESKKEIEPMVKGAESIKSFVYSSGYLLEVGDMGFYDGVNLTLSHPQYEKVTIILPPAQVKELVQWLKNTMGQKGENENKKSKNKKVN